MKTAFIDWTDEKLNLFTFEKQGSRYIHKENTIIDLKDGSFPDDLGTAITADTKSVYLSLPVSMLTLREQSFPYSDSIKIRDTIAYELEGMLLGSVDDYSIDIMTIEDREGFSRALAVCLGKQMLADLIKRLSAKGLDPRVVTCLDLRLAGGSEDKLLNEPVNNIDIRLQAATDELVHPTINLRQENLSYTGDVDTFMKGLRTTSLLLLILLIIVGAGSVANLASLKNENESLARTMQTSFSRVFPEDRKIIDAERQFKGNINKLMKKKDALAGVAALDIMRSIAENRKSGVTLHEFSADGKNILIKGTAANFEEVEALKNDLAATFRNIKVTDSGSRAGKKIDFTIIMQEITT